MRSRSLLATIIRLAVTFYTCVAVCACVCVQWKLLRVLNETQNIRLYVHACVRVYMYICISIYVHVRWARDRRFSVCVCFWYRCMRACYCVRVCCDVLAKNQPTYWSNRAAAFGSYAKKLWKLQLVLLLRMSGLILCSGSSGTVCLLATRLRTFICIMGPPVECGSKIKTRKLSFFMKYAQPQGRTTAQVNR